MTITARKWIQFNTSQGRQLITCSKSHSPKHNTCCWNSFKVNGEPTQAYLTAVKRIFQYLNVTLDIALWYKPTSNTLMGYSDADWANNLDD